MCIIWEMVMGMVCWRHWSIPIKCLSGNGNKSWQHWVLKRKNQLLCIVHIGFCYIAVLLMFVNVLKISVDLVGRNFFGEPTFVLLESSSWVAKILDFRGVRESWGTWTSLVAKRNQYLRIIGKMMYQWWSHVCEHMLSLTWIPSSTAQRAGGLMFTKGNSQGVDLGVESDPGIPGISRVR